jgi:hypothetical protein
MGMEFCDMSYLELTNPHENIIVIYSILKPIWEGTTFPQNLSENNQIHKSYKNKIQTLRSFVNALHCIRI